MRQFAARRSRQKTAIWSTVFRRATHAGPPPASKASAIASAESSKLAYESILLLTGGSASDSAKKADSLDGFTPEPAK